MQEKTVETKTCKQCNTSFEITDKDLEFYNKISPKFNDEIFQIPTPLLCPECRQKRRLSFRNERSLYKRKCDLTGKSLISLYSPDKNLRIYDEQEWWKDDNMSLEYGLNIDFNKPFLEQFKELLSVVPRPSLHVIGNENCDFVNQCGYSKSCYLSYNTDFSENCIYCKNTIKSNYCMDCLNIDECSFCYNSIDLNKCYKSFFSQKCNDSSNLYFCFNLVNCNNCIGCINLINKEYYIFNEKYTKNEYEELSKKLLLDFEKSEIHDKINKLNLKIPKTNNIKNCENCIGDNLLNSKNLKNCFDCFNNENISFCSDINNSKDLYDFDVGGYSSELNMEMLSSGDKNYNCLFCSNIWGNSSNLYYSDIIVSSKNCFGCVGLRNKEYCILNKQYTKEEYEQLVPKIIAHMQKTGEWGEFFPASISTFGYNETVASEYYQLEKDDAIKQGFNWSDYEIPLPKVEKVIPASKLPEDIKDIPDDILNWAIECEVTKKPFRIIKQELEFYRKHNLPIPKKHPDQRNLDRMTLRNPRKLYDRKCDKCFKEIKTTYAPNREEIIYCEGCYNKEVY